MTRERADAGSGRGFFSRWAERKAGAQSPARAGRGEGSDGQGSADPAQALATPVRKSGRMITDPLALTSLAQRDTPEPADTAPADGMNTTTASAAPLPEEHGESVEPSQDETSDGRKIVASSPTDHAADELASPPGASFTDVDLDALDYASDFTRFLGNDVPDAIRRRALSQLWRSNPVLANVDGLNDYDDDFTDAAMVVKGMKTAWQVGRGYLSDEEVAERDVALAADQVSEDDHEASDSVAIAARTDGDASAAEAPVSEDSTEDAEHDGASAADGAGSADGTTDTSATNLADSTSANLSDRRVADRDTTT
ncbi:MAG: DUF3306 domain-containing protein [Pseudomonadota bacterium]